MTGQGKYDGIAALGAGADGYAAARRLGAEGAVHFIYLFIFI
jgi:hypothetical protein